MQQEVSKDSIVRPRIALPQVVGSTVSMARPVIKASQRVKKGITKNGKRKEGPPFGSENPHRGRVVRQAILAALKKRGRWATMQALEEIADKLVEMALGKKGLDYILPASKELFDRLDGKAAQTLIGDPNQPLFVKAVHEMTDAELEQVARGETLEGEFSRK